MCALEKAPALLLNKNQVEKGEVDALPKKEKDMKAAEWLMAI